VKAPAFAAPEIRESESQIIANSSVVGGACTFFLAAAQQ